MVHGATILVCVLCLPLPSLHLSDFDEIFFYYLFFITPDVGGLLFLVHYSLHINFFPAQTMSHDKQQLIVTLLHVLRSG